MSSVNELLIFKYFLVDASSELMKKYITSRYLILLLNCNN